MTSSPIKTLAASLTLLAACAAASAQQGPQFLPAIALNAGMYNIRAELAQTPLQREIGLMNRPSLPAASGMLFVFEEPATQCFWMKNTLIPLSVAFIADDGTVVNVDEMKAQTLNSHCSTQPVRYVLEMNQGWFKKRGIGPGSKLDGAPFATR